MPRRGLWSQANGALGASFPSVRELSKTLKINSNTDHKVVTLLVAEGALEVYSGIRTVVSKRTCSTARSNLLHKGREQVIVEAQRLGLTFDEVTSAVAQFWKRLDGSKR